MRQLLALLALSSSIYASPVEQLGGFAAGWTTHKLLNSMESAQYHRSAELICTNILACTTTVTPTVTRKATVTRTSFTKTTVIPHVLQTRTSTVAVTQVITPADATVDVSTAATTETVATGTSTTLIADAEPTTVITATDDVYSTTSTDAITSVTSTLTSFTSTTVETDYTTTSTTVVTTTTSTSTNIVTTSTEVDPTTVATEVDFVTQVSTTTDSTSYSSFTSYTSAVTFSTIVATDVITTTTETDYSTSYTDTSTVVTTVETDVFDVVTATHLDTKISTVFEPTTLTTTLITTVVTGTTTAFTTTVTIDVFDRREPVPAIDCDTALRSIWLNSYGAAQLKSACSCIATAPFPTLTVTHPASTITKTLTDTIYGIDRVTSGQTQYVTKTVKTTATAPQATDTVVKSYTSIVDFEDVATGTTLSYYTIDAATTTTIDVVATTQVDIDASFFTALYEETLLGAIETYVVDAVASTELDVVATTLTSVTATTTATTVVLVSTGVVSPSEIDLVSTEVDSYTQTVAADVAVTSVELLEASTTLPTTVTTTASIISTSTVIDVVTSQTRVTTVTDQLTADVVSTATATVLATATCAAQPVVNGDFQTGGLAPWYVVVNPEVSASVVSFDGSYVLETSNLHDVEFCRVNQALSTCIGAYYACSLQVYFEAYYADPTYGSPALTIVLVYPGNSETILASYSMTGPSSAQVFHNVNFHFVGSGSDVLGLNLYSPQAEAAGSNYGIIDNVVCNAVA